MSLDADPLFSERNAFHKGLFQTVVRDAATKPGAEALVLRARIEIDAAEVVAELRGEKDDLRRAAYALALHKTGETAESLEVADALIGSTDADVQLLVATVLAREEGRSEEAVDILNTIDDSLDAVALLIQIYLDTDQLAQAQSTLQAAKAWAQDAELIQLAEAWVSLRAGGVDHYQSAFYTAQELADSAGTPARMLLAQAVAEIHLGHYDEAAGTLQQVLAKDGADADALADNIVLKTLTGKDVTADVEKLEEVDPRHPMIARLNEKMGEFETLKGNYTYVEA